jgi:hypothetical protein
MFRPSALSVASFCCLSLIADLCLGQYYYVQPTYAQPTMVAPAYMPSATLVYESPAMFQQPQMHIEHSNNSDRRADSNHSESHDQPNVRTSPEAFRQFVERAFERSRDGEANFDSTSSDSIPAQQVAFQQAITPAPGPSDQYGPLNNLPAEAPGEAYPLPAPAGDGSSVYAPSDSGSGDYAADDYGRLPRCLRALHILKYPGILGQIDCCPDNSTGNCDCDIKRFFTKEEALRCCHDPNCVICVQEPFICEKICFEETEVVFFRCYEKCEPFKFARCEDQRCIQEVGKRTVKKLDPCTVKIRVPIRKLVIEYRKVWICINCPLPHCPHPTAGLGPANLEVGSRPETKEEPREAARPETNATSTDEVATSNPRTASAG